LEKKEFGMALNAHEDPMTEEQRKELKRLCHEADIPDKSGELLTRSGAQEIIEELRRKPHTHKS
jgi:arginyl-tRNA synthetase